MGLTRDDERVYCIRPATVPVSEATVRSSEERSARVWTETVFEYGSVLLSA